jgi:hypothetical protein
MPHCYSAFALLAAALALPAAAQSPAAKPSSPPGPLNATASVPALRYQPVFADFKAQAEQPVGDWKQANDRTVQIGGWRSYARQAQEPQPASEATSAPAGVSGSPPPTPAHRHHKPSPGAAR